MQNTVLRFAACLCLAAMLPAMTFAPAAAQSRPQRPTITDGKRNQRPTPKTPEQIKAEEEEKRRQEEERNATVEPDVLSVDTNIVNVDAVVMNRKTGQIITGLKKENFAVFENGVKQNISSFNTPESPITVTLVLEYSKWTETFGRASGGIFEPGVYESVRPVAQFLMGFIKPPDDYASVIAFDLRPTPITDFTNDPNRIRQTIDLLLRNSPAFRENNLFDALKFSLIGGRGDSVVLENSESRTSDYAGMVNVKAKRKAIILVASGIDTFSKINFGDTRKIIQEAGIPLYLDPMRVMPGTPDRMTFMQAKNQMNTFAKESGGMHFEMTFESEIPQYLQSINSLLRSQYNMAYDLEKKHEAGKKYKLEVKVDVDGDGAFDDKTYVVQHRPFVAVPDDGENKKGRKS
jgi:VWFA-related protein